MRKMVKFETISSEEFKFGTSGFIEVARKKAVDKDKETEFIAISKGWYAQDGSRRFKSSVSVPKELVEAVSEKLRGI